MREFFLERALQLRLCAELVVGALDEDLGYSALCQEAQVVSTGGQSNRNEARNMLQTAAKLQDDASAKGEARQGEGKSGMSRANPVQRGTGIFDFSHAARVFALAKSYSAEVET